MVECFIFDIYCQPMKLRIIMPLCSLLMLFYSCKKERIDLNGSYGMVNYFSPVKKHVGYAEPFLLEVQDSAAFMYGSVLMRGAQVKLKRTGDTLQIFKGCKFYKSSNDFILETTRDGKTRFEKFRKYEGLNEIIANREVAIDKLTAFLNRSLIAGKYKLNGEVVEFKADGTVTGLPHFKSYTILPRRGTLKYYDNCIIVTDDNEAWKYEFTDDMFQLTRYSDKRDEWEMYILSNEKIILKGN